MTNEGKGMEERKKKKSGLIKYRRMVNAKRAQWAGKLVRRKISASSTAATTTTNEIIKTAMTAMSAMNDKGTMNDLATCQSFLIVAAPAFVHRCLPRRLQLRVRISAGHFASFGGAPLLSRLDLPRFSPTTFSVRTGLVGDANHTLV